MNISPYIHKPYIHKDATKLIVAADDKEMWNIAALELIVSKLI